MEGQKPYIVAEDYIEYVPKKLPPMYMFLPINVHTIDHFSTETLWGSVPSSFNDPFDSLGTINEEILKNWFYKQYEVSPHLFPQEHPIEEVIEGMIKGTIDGFSNLRKNFLISCFTPNIESEIMWAHYGRNATGFALKYSALDIIECKEKYFTKYREKGARDASAFCPVLYYDEPVDITQIALEQAEKLLYSSLGEDEKQEARQRSSDGVYPFYRLLFHKNKCWSYEEEYRLCVQNFPSFFENEKSTYIQIGHCKPKGIYLGMSIEKSNEQILSRVAQEKNIPIYKMKSIIKNGRYCLVGEEIE